MSRYTINYKEKSNAETYLKIFLGFLLLIAVIMGVFLFLVNNSALAKKNKTAAVARDLISTNEYVGQLSFVNVYEGDQLYYVTSDFFHYYVHDQDLVEVFKADFEDVVSIEKIDKVFQNNYDCILLGYSSKEETMIYEIKVFYGNSVGYYYYDALNADFIKFYVLGGDANE